MRFDEGGCHVIAGLPGWQAGYRSSMAALRTFSELALS